MSNELGQVEVKILVAFVPIEKLEHMIWYS